jgi:hypothetical protein
VELGLPEKINYTEATEKNTVTLNTATFHNMNYLFPKFCVLYPNTIKGKQFIVEIKVTQMSEQIYIYIYIYNIYSVLPKWCVYPRLHPTHRYTIFMSDLTARHRCQSLPSL